MAKRVYQNAQDGALTAQRGTHIAVCSGEPTDYTNMVALTLANTAISGSYTLGPGAPSGRADTCPAQVDANITGAGTQDATHVVTHNNTDTVYIATTCPTQPLTNGGTVDISAWANNLTDPT